MKISSSMRFTPLLLVCCLLLLPSGTLWAMDPLPFHTRNLNPFIQVFGLPGAESGTTVAAHTWQAHLIAEAANHFTMEGDTDHGILLDGETYRFSTQIRYGISDLLETGIDIPYIIHARGFLDGFIEGWHDTFGLPQNGRKHHAKKQLQFLYNKDGRKVLNVTNQCEGIGDIQLSAAIPLFPGRAELSPSLALRFGLKIPTGDSAKLLGSGSVDSSIRLAATDQRMFANYDVSINGVAGMLLVGAQDHIPTDRHNLVGIGALSITWNPPAYPIALQVQLDGHTSFFHSNLDTLSAGSLQLIMGGTIFLSNKYAVQIAVAEDMISRIAPDVVFHFELTREF